MGPYAYAPGEVWADHTEIACPAAITADASSLADAGDVVRYGSRGYRERTETSFAGADLGGYYRKAVLLDLAGGAVLPGVAQRVLLTVAGFANRRGTYVGSAALLGARCQCGTKRALDTIDFLARQGLVEVRWDGAGEAPTGAFVAHLLIGRRRYGEKW